MAPHRLIACQFATYQFRTKFILWSSYCEHKMSVGKLNEICYCNFIAFKQANSPGNPARVTNEWSLRVLRVPLGRKLQGFLRKQYGSGVRTKESSPENFFWNLFKYPKIFFGHLERPESFKLEPRPVVISTMSPVRRQFADNIWRCGTKWVHGAGCCGSSQNGVHYPCNCRHDQASFDSGVDNRVRNRIRLHVGQIVCQFQSTGTSGILRILPKQTWFLCALTSRRSPPLFDTKQKRCSNVETNISLTHISLAHPSFISFQSKAPLVEIEKVRKVKNNLSVKNFIKKLRGFQEADGERRS